MHSQMVTTLSRESIDQLRSSLYETGRQPNTIKAYSTDLEQLLIESEADEIPIVNLESVGLYWLQSNRNILKPKTTSRRLTSLRIFARWTGHPQMFKDFIAPTPAATIPHPLPEGIEGVRRLINTAQSDTHKALVALCGFCGCRISEAISVRPSNFKLHSMLLEIRGKGDKSRLVPVSPEAWQHLAGPVLKASMENDRKVVNILDRNARAVITKLGERSGLSRHISSHDLRATFATAVNDKTGDIRLVQELLGHASVSSTEIYVKVRLEKMRNAVML